MNLSANLIKKARPKLSKIAPLSNAICWGYAVANLAIGIGLFFIYQGTTAPILVANIFTYPQWGIIFLSMSTLTVVALLQNNWEFTRFMQLIGLMIKGIWAIALVVMSFEFPQTILITIVWFFLLFIQAVTYIYFLPTLDKSNVE